MKDYVVKLQFKQPLLTFLFCIQQSMAKVHLQQTLRHVWKTRQGQIVLPIVIYYYQNQITQTSSVQML